jgi:hypothetical protein
MDLANKQGVFYGNWLYVPVAELKPKKKANYLVTFELPNQSKAAELAVRCYEPDKFYKAQYVVSDCIGRGCFSYAKMQNGKNIAHMSGESEASDLLKAIAQGTVTRSK